MNILAHLIELFKETTAITAIIGSGDTMRAYPMMMPQGVTYPCVTLQRITSMESTKLAGPDGYTHARIQIDLWAETYTELSALEAALRARLAAYQGDRKGIAVRSCVMASRQDIAEPDVKVLRVSMDYMIWHTE